MTFAGTGDSQILCSNNSNNDYFVNGNLYATIPFNTFLFYNQALPSPTYYFADINGSFYAFTGSVNNNFTFSGGRTLTYNGTPSYTGWRFNSGGVGYTTTLFWNGTNYFVISNPGAGIPVT